MLKKLSTLSNGTSRWRIRLRMPKGYAKPMIHTHFKATQSEAHAIYSDLLKERARYKLGLKNPDATKELVRLAEAVSQYLLGIQTVGLNSKYIERMSNMLALLQEVAGEHTPIDSVSREHISVWLQRRKLSQRYGKTPSALTINTNLNMLSAFFTFCMKERGWITANPAQAVSKLKTITEEPKILYWSDYCKFAHACWLDRPLFAVLIEVVAEAGARIEEVMNAKVGDIDIKQRTWRRRVKPGRIVTPDAKQWALWCAADRNKDEPLCPREDGKRWRYDTVFRLFERYRKAIDSTDLTPHYFRHARACWLLAEGVHPYEVKNFLCHTDFATTERYVRAAELIKRAEPSGTIHEHLCRFCHKTPFTTLVSRGLPCTTHKQGKRYKAPSAKELECKSLDEKDLKKQAKK